MSWLFIEARAKQPFRDREELRAEGLLNEAQWTSAVAFLRVRGGPNPLDATALHPEMYDLATQLLDSAGGSVQESLGRPGVTKGLRRAGYDVDEATWRDIMRELSQPGRDPRPRLFRPELLDPDTDRARLMTGRVVEGIVTNVASFGAFVEIGLAQDAMVHISEMSSRYVRDARELLSIGQTLRAKILEPGGQRLALSLKDVGDPRRPAPGARRERRSESGERGPRRRGQRQERGPKTNPNLRAAQERRDGIGGVRSTRGGRGPGGGRGDSRRRPDSRSDRGERVNLNSINAEANEGASYSPFASFFKVREGDEPESKGPARSERAPAEETPPKSAQEPREVEAPEQSAVEDRSVSE